MGFNDFADQFGTRRPGSDSADEQTPAAGEIIKLIIKVLIFSDK